MFFPSVAMWMFPCWEVWYIFDPVARRRLRTSGCGWPYAFFPEEMIEICGVVVWRKGVDDECREPWCATLSISILMWFAL